MLLILRFPTTYDFPHIQWLDKVQCLIKCLILSVVILVLRFMLSTLTGTSLKMAERHFFPEAVTSFLSTGFKVMFRTDSLSESPIVSSRTSGTLKHKHARTISSGLEGQEVLIMKCQD